VLVVHYLLLLLLAVNTKITSYNGSSKNKVKIVALFRRQKAIDGVFVNEKK